MAKSVKAKALTPIKKLINRLRPGDPGDVWQRAAQTAVVVTIVATILTVFGATSDTWQLPKMWMLVVGTAIAWICYVVMNFKRRTTQWAWHPLDILVGVFVLAVGISAATSVSWWKSVFGISGWRDQSFVMIAAGAVLYFLIARLFTGAKERMLVWWALFGSIGVSFLIHLFQLGGFSMWPEPWHSQVWFNVAEGSPRQLSILAAFFSTGMTIVTVTAQQKWSRWMAFVGVIIGWIFLLFLGQAIGWAMVAVGMMLVILQATRQKGVHAGWMIMAVVIAVSGMIAQMTKLADHSGFARPYEVTLDQRTSSQVAMTTLFHRPVLGSGPVTWYEDFVKYRDREYNQSPTWNLRFQQAGASWWQTIATLGVVGTLLWMSILVMGWWTGWQAWQKKGESWLLLGVTGSAFVFISGWFATWSLPMLLITWVGLGLTRAAMLEQSKAKSKSYASMHMLGDLAVAAVIIFSIIPISAIAASDVAMRNAQRWFDTLQSGQAANNTKALSQATSWLQRSVDWDRYNSTSLLLLANTQAIQVQQLVGQENLTEAAKSLQAMQNTLALARSRFPRDPMTFETENNLLNLLSGAMQNAAAQAKANFATLRALEPQNPIQDVGYGQTLMVERAQLIGTQSAADSTKAAALLTEALAVYQKAIEKKPEYYQAHYAHAQALVSAERYAEVFDELPVDSTAPTAQQALTYQVRAQAYVGLKKDDLAIASFKSAILAYGQDPLTYLLFSDFYSTTKKDKKSATEVLDQGLKALPGNAQLEAAKKAL